MTFDIETDVLIVGGGIMGSAVAALLRETDPDLDIVMVDAGDPIGDVVGRHLHESDDPEIWERYNQRVSSGIQGLYAGDETFRPAVGSREELELGMHRLATLGEDADEFSGAALAWNAGGMGVHWTAATPSPGSQERWGDESRWPQDLQTAARLLRITEGPLGPTVAGEHIVAALRRRFPDVPADRTPRAMPMAVTVQGDRRIRTGPATIFPPIAVGGDPAFRLLTGTLATALEHESDAVIGAQVHRHSDGETGRIRSLVTIVCADALRTPQLLFASGIRPEALGRYLNEHAFISNRVLLDLERFGLTLDDLPAIPEGETVTDSLWLPASAEQPLQAQIMARPYIDDDERPLAFGVGVSIYVPLDSRAENRIDFDDDTDIAGMPRMRVRFGYSDADGAAIADATEVMATIAADLGDWDRQNDSLLLAPGSSLHMTGTVRSGETDDGTSVCDPGGRVWGFRNLFVAGNGVIPTPMAGNVTLTGVVTAIRAAERITSLLARRTEVSA
jgi:choline dehydrogenase-like flavoprotein